MLDEIKEKIKWKVSDGLVEYEEAIKFMENEVENIVLGKSFGTIWLTQHPSIYTAGISSKQEDLINEKQIPVFKTNRGGQYTYHGPGIRIIYVMIDIKKIFNPEKPDISRFVKMLENWIINILGNIGIKGNIRKNRIGIWIEKGNGKEDKIAAIGIKVRKWVSYHGIALNVDPDLKFFNGIVPCGIKEEKFGVTSLKKEGINLGEDELNKIIKSEFNNLNINNPHYGY